MKLSEDICLFFNKFFPKPLVSGRESPQAYSDMEYGWGKATLELFAPYMDFNGKKVLDAGCGLGGRTVYYAENGCDHIVGIDINEDHIKYANEYARKKGILNADFVAGCLSELPFEDGVFDIIFLNDVVEHISRSILIDALEECKRVIKKGGRICLEFPPWTGARAGHLYDYIHIPWCQVLFSPETLVNVVKRMSSNNKLDKHSYIEHFQQLNHITARDFKGVIREIDFKVIHYNQRMIKNIKPLRYIPYFNKFLISRVNAVLSK